MSATRRRPMNSTELGTDEWRVDRGRGRRHCRVHPQQEMIPLAPHLDACPLPHPQAEGDDTER